MAYFLQIKLPNGSYKSLDISKSSKFNLRDVYDVYNNNRHLKIDKKSFEVKINTKEIKYSLSSINNFTMQFRDENELRAHLVSTGILESEFINSPLVIRFVSNRKAVKNYNLFFMDDYFYFMPDKLIGLIEERYLSDDFNFLLSFAKYFCDSKESICKDTAIQLYNFSIYAINYNYITQDFNRLDANGDNVVVRLAKLLIYKYKVKRVINDDVVDNVITYNKNQFNWRTLHILIEFFKEYEFKEMNDSKKVIPNVKDGSLLQKKFIRQDFSNDNKDLEQLDFSDLIDN